MQEVIKKSTKAMLTTTNKWSIDIKLLCNFADIAMIALIYVNFSQFIHIAQEVWRGRGQLHREPDGARHLRRRQPRDQRRRVHHGAALQGRNVTKFAR